MSTAQKHNKKFSEEHMAATEKSQDAYRYAIRREKDIEHEDKCIRRPNSNNDKAGTDTLHQSK